MTLEKRGPPRRALMLAAGLLAATMAGAQAPTPSWGTAPSAQQTPPASPRQPAAAGVRRDLPSAATHPQLPLPGEVDCTKSVQKPVTIYYGDGAWVSDGEYSKTGAMTPEHGELRQNHYDQEMRIEQLRCETKNIKEKLDFLIRRLS